MKKPRIHQRILRELKFLALHPLKSTALSLIKTLKLEQLAQKLHLFEPKVIRYVDGGITSQMFMFAKGYYYAKRRNLPLYLDLSWFDNSGLDLNGNKNRGLLLFEAFPEIRKRYAECVMKPSSFFDFLYTDTAMKRGREKPASISLPPHSVYLYSYEFNMSYILEYIDDFKELFKMQIELTPEEKILAEQIHNTESCALHIRRGDFIGSMHEVCTEEYYLNAIEKMRSMVPDCVFYVFSNDESYVRKLLSNKEGCFVFIENRTEENPTADLWLMQECRHAIISNSGFSLMPAILSYSDDKKVILPDKWNQSPQGKDIARSHQLPGWDIIEC